MKSASMLFPGSTAIYRRNEDEIYVAAFLKPAAAQIKAQ